MWACGDCGACGTGTVLPASCPECGARSVAQAPAPPIAGVSRWRPKHAGNEVEVIRFTGSNTAEVTVFLGGPYASTHQWAATTTNGGTLITKTGETAFWPGDWIVRVPDGGFEAYRDEVFRAMFEPVQGTRP